MGPCSGAAALVDGRDRAKGGAHERAEALLVHVVEVPSAHRQLAAARDPHGLEAPLEQQTLGADPDGEAEPGKLAGHTRGVDPQVELLPQRRGHRPL